MKPSFALKFLIPFLLLANLLAAQTTREDSIKIRSLFDEALENGHAYENLRELCKDIGHRLSGSPEAEEAVKWGEALLRSYDMDSVWLQPVMVPHWVRGDVEWARTASSDTLSICALGGSVASDGPESAQVVRFAHLDSLKNADPDKVKGKMVFIDQEMDASLINTFHAYGGCAAIRYHGARVASMKGAKAVMVRSLTLDIDDYPHTGSMGYADSVPKIPAMAVSTKDAEWLTNQLQQRQVSVDYQLSCQTLPDKQSYNVIGELRGTEHPEKVIVVGGHLDSWDLGEGAHDDGAGVVQSIEVVRMFKDLGIRPRNTIRCILFMNEENGNNGGKKYARWAKENNVEHVAALESDRGGFAPRGFTMEGHDSQVDQLQSWENTLEPYLLHIFKRGYSGVDIRPLKDGKTPLIGHAPDSQRYFDYHHSAADTFDKVDNRELHMGAASMASLVYLIDRYGFPEPIEDN